MLFNHSELMHWIVTQATRLPIKTCVEIIERQGDLDLLSVHETKQVLRILELFARYDVMLLVATISMQDIHPDIRMQLSVKQLKNIYQFLQETRNLRRIADFSQWPKMSENPMSLEVMSPEFKNNLLELACNRYSNGAVVNNQLSAHMAAYLVENEETADELIFNAIDDAYVAKMRDELGMSRTARTALMKNPRYFTSQSANLKLLDRRLDASIAYQLNHEPAIDFFVNTKAFSYGAAYQKGWKPGRAFAFCLEHYPNNAKKLIQHFPKQVQADLIYFTYLQYGMGVHNLLGDVLHAQEVMALLSNAQRNLVCETIRLATSQSTEEEIPAFLLGKILQLTEDKQTELSIRSFAAAGNCRLLSEQAPTTQRVEVYLKHLQKSIARETDALIKGVRNPIWTRTIPFRRWGLKVSRCAFYLSIVNLTVMMVLMNIDSRFMLIRKMSRNSSNDNGAWISDFLLNSVLYFGLVFLAFVASVPFRRPQAQIPVINDLILLTPNIRDQRTQLQDSVQLLDRLMRVFSRMDYYQYQFLIMDEIAEHIVVIKKVCELLRDYQANGPIDELTQQINLAPFSAEELRVFRPERFATLNEFFADLSQKSLYAVQENGDLMDRLERYRDNHPLPVSFWKSLFPSRAALREVDERDRMYLMV